MRYLILALSAIILFTVGSWAEQLTPRQQARANVAAHRREAKRNERRHRRERSQRRHRSRHQHA